MFYSEIPKNNFLTKKIKMVYYLYEKKGVVVGIF